MRGATACLTLLDMTNANPAPIASAEARCRAEAASWTPERRAVGAHLLIHGWPRDAFGWRISLPADDVAALAILRAAVS